MPIERTTLSPRHYIGIRRQVSVKELQPYFHEVLPAVMGWAAKNGIEPASAPMAMWHAMDPDTGIADVQAGCFVSESIPGEGEITGGTTPSGDALELVHTGSYAKMSESWGKLFRHVADIGAVPGAGWEIYVDDPTTTEPDALRTEITLPITT